MPTLVIQMGHCYRTTGATGTSGEQQFATRVGTAALGLLGGKGWDIRTILADAPMSDYRGDAFFAVHCDGSTSAAAHGASGGHQGADGAALLSAWKRAYHEFGWKNGFRPDNYTAALAGYYGVRNARAQGNTRACIVECGFLTNAEDRLLLLGPGGVERVVLAMGRALGITDQDQDEEDDVKPFQGLMLAREAEGAEGSSWPKVFVGDGITCRHVASETDLSNLQYRIRQAGGNADVAEGWAPGSLFGVLGVEVKATQP